MNRKEYLLAWRAKNQEKLKAHQSTPEYKERARLYAIEWRKRHRDVNTPSRSEIAKKLWERPEYREKFVGRKYSAESIQKMREAHTGKQWSEESRKKLSDAKKGSRHSEETKRKCGLANIGRQPSEELRKRWSEIGKQRTGEKNFNWRGGITPLAVRIRMSARYSQWRQDIFVRDEFACVSCGTVRKQIEAHHSPRSFMSILRGNHIKCSDDAMRCEEFWDINNGVTLCHKCHVLSHRRKAD